MQTAAHLAYAMLLTDTLFQMSVDLIRMGSAPAPIVFIAVIAFPMVAITLAAVLVTLGRSIRSELRVAT